MPELDDSYVDLVELVRLNHTWSNAFWNITASLDSVVEKFFMR